MKTKVIQLSQLEDYFRLCQLEQTFRVKLTTLKEMKERELEFVKELKTLAERLSDLKHSGFKLIEHDKELDKQVRIFLNKRFKGGVLNA